MIPNPWLLMDRKCENVSDAINIPLTSQVYTKGASIPTFGTQYYTNVTLAQIPRIVYSPSIHWRSKSFHAQYGARFVERG